MNYRMTSGSKTDAPKAPYHHGDLRVALLEAAERLLLRDGIEGLTLRAAAREAGVSHAAPKNHFENLTGLLSDLAAVGYERFGEEMTSGLRDNADPEERMSVIGRGYITFALANPAMFQLMFRNERLDYDRPALLDASNAAFSVLSGSVGAQRQESVGDVLTIEQAASAASSWALVHGLSMLLLDGQLNGLLARAPKGTDVGALLKAIFKPDVPPDK